jgi:hypothetical protein
MRQEDYRYQEFPVRCNGRFCRNIISQGLTLCIECRMALRRMRQDYRPSPDVFISEFPRRCNGSFCHQRNIIPAYGFTLCPECRMAKRHHSYNERGRWKDRERINNRRAWRRHAQRMKRATQFPFRRKPISELLRMATRGGCRML